jgi:alpha-tubulin suppressor-like RCC1 family protein
MRSIVLVSVLSSVALAAAGCSVPTGSVDDAGAAAAAPPEPSAMPTANDAGPVDASSAARRPAACETGCEIVDVALGRAHTCVRRANGDVLCLGRNRWGELGDGSARHESCDNRGDVEQTDCSGAPVRVGLDESAVALSARGGASTCALAADGTLSCWGIGFTLREGGPTIETPRYDPERVAAPSRLVDVSEGARHTCALTARGEVVCRGLGFAGQLGAGEMLDREDFAPVPGMDDATDVETSAAGDFTCALTARGVYCWGDASSGQLGDGDHAHDACGGGLSRFDCALSPVRVDGLDTAVELTLGASHACALDADGTVWCWGENAQGQLGVEGVERASTPVVVPGASPAVAISAGATFTCAVRADGTVLCWGDDGFGQLGDGDAGGTTTCVRSGELTSCRAAPAPVVGITNAVTIAAGSAHACALADDGAVHCWGLNDARQLGDGARGTRSTPVIARFDPAP